VPSTSAMDSPNPVGIVALGNATMTGPLSWDLGLGKSMSEAFSSSFFMILATELGDETFIIAAVMSMRHPKTIVLGGALSALYIMTVLSAILGLVLPNLISQKTVHNCATVLYTFFGARLMYIGARSGGEDKDEEFEEVENTLKESATKEQTSTLRRVFSRIVTPIFIEAFILTFLAEWGDRSQIATITLASHQNPIGVIVGACIGHTICTGLAVYGGEWLGKRISQRVVAFLGGFLFLLFAVINFFVSHVDEVHTRKVAGAAAFDVLAGGPLSGGAVEEINLSER